MKISAVIVNYNHGHYLSHQLDALANQTRPADEVIFVDDGSTDDSLEIADSFYGEIPNLVVVSQPENKGIMYSTNHGVDMASGDLVYCGCSNDVVDYSFFEKTGSMLEEYPLAGLCTSDPAHFCDEWRSPNIYGWPEGFICPTELSELIQGGRFVSGFTTLYRRDLYLKYGGLLEDLKWHSDWFLNLLLAFKHGICYTAGPVAWTRWSADGYAHKGVFDFSKQKDVLDNIFARLDKEEMDWLRTYIRDSNAAQVLGPYSHYLSNRL